MLTKNAANEIECLAVRLVFTSSFSLTYTTSKEFYGKSVIQKGFSYLLSILLPHVLSHSDTQIHFPSLWPLKSSTRSTRQDVFTSFCMRSTQRLAACRSMWKCLDRSSPVSITPFPISFNSQRRSAVRQSAAANRSCPVQLALGCPNSVVPSFPTPFKCVHAVSMAVLSEL